MQIQCIHNEKRTDRLKLLTNEIATHGLQIVLWPAVIDPLIRFRGVAQAHKQIVRWAQKERLSMVCIAEDDFHITGKGCWDYFLKNIPKDFDLYLSGVFNGFVNEQNILKSSFNGLHLYIINGRFYGTFLSLPETMNIDFALTGKGKFVVCDPFIATQHNGWSDNNQKHLILDHYLAGRKICCDYTF